MPPARLGEAIANRMVYIRAGREPGRCRVSRPSQGAIMSEATEHNSSAGDRVTRFEQHVGEPPTSIGRYVIGQKFASGGMGDIYHAEHPALRMPVAIKVMKVRFHDPADVRRFEHEYQSLARMQHPGIARVFDAGTYETTGGLRPYFVMEYIPGAKSITDYANSNHLGVNDRLRLFIDVCRAVDHANDRGVIHRDLKPSNILVGADGQVRLIDFGVAADLASPDSIGRPGQRMGTYSYMSPEMIEADPLANDRRSDVYTLGVVLYELLTGHLPYDVAERSAHDAVRIIASTTPERMSRYNSDIPRGLEELIQVALCKERRQRFETAGAFANRIGEFVEWGTNAATTTSWSPGRRLTGWRGWVREQYVISLGLAAMTGWFFAFLIVGPFISRMTPINGRYESAIMASVAPQPFGRPESSRVVVIHPRSAFTVMSAAQALDITGVTMDETRSWRLLWGPLLDAIREADARVAAFDIQFSRADPEFDPPFAEALERARDAGLPVIAGNLRWDHTSDPDVVCSPNLRPYLRIGGVTLHAKHGDPLSVEAAVFPPDRRQSRASIPLTAYAAYRFPQALLDVYLEEFNGTVSLSYYRETDMPGVRRTVVPPEIMPFSTLTVQRQQDIEHGVPEGSVVAHWVVAETEPEKFRHQTIDLSAFFMMSESERRSAVRDRVVIIGMPFSHDSYEVGPGKWVHGVHIHAAAMNDMINRRPILRARPLHNLLAVFLVVGCTMALVRPLERRWASRLALYVAVTVLVILATIAAYYTRALLVSPFMLVSAAVVSGEIAVVIYRIRRSRGARVYAGGSGAALA